MNNDYDIVFDFMALSLKPFASIGPIEWSEYDYKENIFGNVNMPIRNFKNAREAIALKNKLRKFEHIKRGTTYTIVGTARVQTTEPMVDYTSVIVYKDESGNLWVRPKTEFFDGRFKEILQDENEFRNDH